MGEGLPRDSHLLRPQGEFLGKYLDLPSPIQNPSSASSAILKLATCTPCQACLEHAAVRRYTDEETLGMCKSRSAQLLWHRSVHSTGFKPAAKSKKATGKRSLGSRIQYLVFCPFPVFYMMQASNNLCICRLSIPRSCQHYGLFSSACNGPDGLTGSPGVSQKEGLDHFKKYRWAAGPLSCFTAFPCFRKL